MSHTSCSLNSPPTEGATVWVILQYVFCNLINGLVKRRFLYFVHIIWPQADIKTKPPHTVKVSHLHHWYSSYWSKHPFFLSFWKIFPALIPWGLRGKSWQNTQHKVFEYPSFNCVRLPLIVFLIESLMFLRIICQCILQKFLQRVDRTTMMPWSCWEFCDGVS